MDSRAIQVYNPSMAALNRARAALSTAEWSEMPLLMQEFLAELENFCPVQGSIPAPTRRSPLPVWYPRRPLQDITRILSSRDGTSNSGCKPELKPKKKFQKCRNIEIPAVFDENSNPNLRQSVPRKPTMYSKTAASVANRGALLRRGFR
ncbi:hypothetical protein MPTK1_2g19860 [Marchantia polymorpha subsp. ruderalis]|uniref:Uncharacterized protein n=1 Tax=Marchantia polymorpha TaxID=3197 RepID=A0A2R6WVB6_MARPO|nr:hypothetical protein MARPO_0055s0064 [Marchantia polymorpha]BBN02995.1 hypothetical protein Mp_2g19860 [Marchantia polymorpha subsp. ruderalis]|eukprot:PTQ37794.1 hypothetical protein MARPO_0055s0064 [Marchantia polymorpha]